LVVSTSTIKELPSGEFASLTDGAIQPFIDEATREINATVFGARYDDAVKYLAAHLLTTMRGGSKSASGAVISETAGPLSRSYAAPSATVTTDELSSTTYGRRYADIRRQCAGGPQVL
jgi:hypothetical protein